MSQSAKQNLLKFELEGYSLAIQGNHIELTDPIKDYAREKVSKIERFSDHILDIIVTLDVQKLAHICTIDVMVKNFKIRAVNKPKKHKQIISIEKKIMKYIGMVENEIIFSKANIVNFL